MKNYVFVDYDSWRKKWCSLIIKIAQEKITKSGSNKKLNWFDSKITRRHFGFIYSSRENNKHFILKIADSNYCYGYRSVSYIKITILNLKKFIYFTLRNNLCYDSSLNIQDFNLYIL